MSLPTEIRQDAKLLFKGEPLYKQMGIDNIRSNRIEMIVTECTPTIQNRFKVVSKFTEASLSKHEKAILDKHIDQYAHKVVLASKNHGSILIFNIEDGNYDIYRFYFGGSPYKFQFAGTPENVLSQIQSSVIDALIIDSNKLGANIISFLEALQQQRKKCPIILITGNQNQNEIAKVASLVQDLIIKPLNGKMLTQRLAKTQKRWEFEEHVQRKIGESVGVSIETKILVVFRDRAIIQRIRKNGLLLYKEYAIVPTTTIYFRANQLFRLLGIHSKNATHIELEVVSCQYDLEKKLYRVIANFKEISDYLIQAVYDFISGKLHPGETLVEPEAVREEKKIGEHSMESRTIPTKSEDWLFLKEPDEEKGGHTPKSEDWLFLKEPDEEETFADSMLPPLPQKQDTANIRHQKIKNENKQKEETPFMIPPKPQVQQYSFSDLIKELPQCKVQSIKNIYFGDEFFSKQERLYISQLKIQKGQTFAHRAKLRQVAQKYLSSNPEFYKQRLNQKLVMQERSAVIRIFSEKLECFIVIGAILKTVSKGMGLSTSQVEDSYDYDPYYLIGIPKPQHLDFGLASEIRTFIDREVAICRATNKDVVHLLPDILKLL